MFVLSTGTPRLLFNKDFPVTEMMFKASHLGFGCWRLELETERKEDRCSRGSRGGLQVKDKVKQNDKGSPDGALGATVYDDIIYEQVSSKTSNSQ